jgi:N-acetylmuramidase
VKELSGTWKQIAGTTSGYGHKLLTLVSDALVVAGGTQPLPQGAPPKPSQPESQPQPHPKGKGTQPPLPKPAQGDPAKNNPATKHRKKKGPQGQPVIQIAVDIPQTLLEYFAGYDAGGITDEDWERAAKDLKCEAEVLKAFAEVESGGRLSFWRLNKGDGANVPAILYERHYFSQLTGHKFDDSHPDLSWPTGYRKKKLLHQSDKKMSDGKVDEDDIYGDYASAYLRLINAYRLNPDAALKSCSWGKFQIMGANYAACGVQRISEFVTLMCKSEADQIDLICSFIRNKPAAWKNPRNKSLGKKISLWDAVKTKNWQAIALNYNGPGYKTYEYDTKLERAYEKYKKA